jgi:hypothetical protein
VTLTFVSGRRPRKALEYMRAECGLRVGERERGIYEVEGGGMPMQIIDGGRLDGEESVWIRGLRGGLEAEALGRMLERSEGRLGEPYMGMYLHAALEANAEILKEVSEMKGGYTLEKYVEEAGLAAKWRNQGMEKGIVQGMEKGIMQVARAMLRKRLPLELIQESTGLSAERIRRLQQQQDAV